MEANIHEIIDILKMREEANELEMVAKQAPSPLLPSDLYYCTLFYSLVPFPLLTVYLDGYFVIIGYFASLLVMDLFFTFLSLCHLLFYTLFFPPILFFHFSLLVGYVLFKLPKEGEKLKINQF